MGAAAAPSRAGELLLGKYRLEQRLAVGGMGEVYRATNVAVGRPVAIKLLRQELTHNESLVRRFLREGRTANRVDHPHIVRVVDIDRAGDQVFIVQDLLEGEDLAQLLKRSGRKLPIGEALQILIPVAEALGAAHAAGLVHRDMKPANVFVAIEGRRRVPKVLDFGIAKVMSPELDGDTPLTQTGDALGTPAFMSPEQVMAPKDVDARSDVWALGVLIHRTITGKLPFRSASAGGVMVAICTEPPVRLSDDLPGVPEPLEEVVTACLARQPEDRYASGAAVARALRGVGELLDEEISGFEWRADTPVPASGVPRSHHLHELEIDLPPASRRSPTPHSMMRPRGVPALEDDLEDAPTLLATPTSAPPRSGPVSGPISVRSAARPVSVHPVSSIPPSGLRSVPPSVSGTRLRPPRIDDPASLDLGPIGLSALALGPTLMLGWGFDSDGGIASVAQRYGSSAIAATGLIAAAAAFRTWLLAREDHPIAYVATIGFAATATLALFAAYAAIDGAPAPPWIARPGAIAAVLAAAGIAALGFERAYAAFSRSPSDNTSAATFGVLSLVVAAAAVRLLF